MDDSGLSEPAIEAKPVPLLELRRALAAMEARAEHPQNDMLRALGPSQALQLDGRGGARVVPNPDRPVVVAGVLVSPELGDALAMVAAGCLAHGLTLDAFIAQARELLAARDR